MQYGVGCPRITDARPFTVAERRFVEVRGHRGLFTCPAVVGILAHKNLPLRDNFLRPGLFFETARS